MSKVSLNVSQLKLALHILDWRDLLKYIHVCASCFEFYHPVAQLYWHCTVFQVLNRSMFSWETVLTVWLRSTWRRLASSSRTLRRTAPWTTCVFSSTWPTTPRECDLDKLKPTSTVCLLSPDARLRYHCPVVVRCLKGQFIPVIYLCFDTNQHRAHHHPSSGTDVCRVLGLPVREARPRHPNGHELLRWGSARGTAAAVLSETSTTLYFVLFIYAFYFQELVETRSSLLHSFLVIVVVQFIHICGSIAEKNQTVRGKKKQKNSLRQEIFTIKKITSRQGTKITAYVKKVLIDRQELAVLINSHDEIIFAQFLSVAQ